MLKGAWLVVLHHDEQIRIYEFRATALGPPRRWLFWCYGRWNGIGAAALKLLVRIQLAPLMVYTKVKGEKNGNIKRG